MLLDTGARCGAARSLIWQQINLKEETISLKRTKAARNGFQNLSTLYMSKRVKEILQRRAVDQAHETWVFTNRAKNGPKNAPGKAFKRAVAAAKIKDFHIHDLRHSAASKLIQNGCSSQEVKVIIGHNDISQTLRYAHLVETDISLKARDIFDRKNKQRKTTSTRCVNIDVAQKLKINKSACLCATCGKEG